MNEAYFEETHDIYELRVQEEWSELKGFNNSIFLPTSTESLKK